MKYTWDIVLDRTKEQHLYIQIYHQIKNRIMTNELPAHYRLPAIRKLATELKVNNVTVINAYKLLEQDNFVYTRVGSGTFVSDINDNIRKETDGISGDFMLTSESSDLLVDFSSSIPSSDLFPVEDFKKMINEVLDRDKGYAFDYQKRQGYYPLRQSIKEYLIKNKINSSVENIQIVSGAQQGIDIVSKTLIDYGDVVFVESPTYSGAIAAFKSRTAKIVEIPIYEDGMDIQILEQKLEIFKPKFIYTMPNFQNPTGYSYCPRKKQKLIELARKYDTLIIEDDYVSELNFSDYDNYTLKSIDHDDRVIYIKSFSKLFMPGLRLGFTIIPNKILQDILVAKHFSDISTSGLIQRSFDLYLRRQYWSKQQEAIFKIYEERYNAMVKSIQKYLPDKVTCTIPKGGVNFWLKLPGDCNLEDIYKLCKENKIQIAVGSYFHVKTSEEKTLRLTIASTEKAAIEEGMMRFSYLIDDYLLHRKDKLKKDYMTFI